MGFVWMKPRLMLCVHNICGQLLNMSGGSAAVWVAMLFLMIALYGRTGVTARDGFKRSVLPYGLNTVPV